MLGRPWGDRTEAAVKEYLYVSCQKAIFCSEGHHSYSVICEFFLKAVTNCIFWIHIMNATNEMNELKFSIIMFTPGMVLLKGCLYHVKHNLCSIFVSFFPVFGNTGEFSDAFSFWLNNSVINWCLLGNTLFKMVFSDLFPVWKYRCHFYYFQFPRPTLSSNFLTRYVRISWV